MTRRLRSGALKVVLLKTASLILVTVVLFYTVNDGMHWVAIPKSRPDMKQVPIKLLRNSLLPRKIWQIYLTPPNVNKTAFEIDPGNLGDAVSWLAHNPNYEYQLVGDDGAEEITLQHFKENPTILKIFRELKNTGMKSDLLRYMLLFIEGGVYSDIDTVNLKPIDSWVPEEHRKHVRVVIGIEFDRLDGDDESEVHPDLQFCQWTIAAAPRHPLFDHMIKGVVTALNTSAMAKDVPFSQLSATSSEVMKLTGPAAWTDAVFRQLQWYDPSFTSLRNLSGLSEPLLVGDMMILPIDGFGMGQEHSNSTHDGSTPPTALVKHKFRGSWRHEGTKN